MQSITLLDGGMGQELIHRSAAKPTPMWSAQLLMDDPSLVRTVHEDFIKAGARVITLNSYSVTPERLARDGDSSKFKPLQEIACRVAQQARDNTGESDVRIAGCLPPLVASYRPELMPSIPVATETYQQIVEAQSESVDLFICETMGSINEAVTASSVAVQSGKPVWVALTIDDARNDCLRSGESLQDAVHALQSIDIAAVLLNCSKPETIRASLPALGSAFEIPIGAYANGFTSIDLLAPGGTVGVLDSRHDLGPDSYADFAMEWVNQGATIVGGCCEVSPLHIARIRQRLDSLSL